MHPRGHDGMSISLQQGGDDYAEERQMRPRFKANGLELDYEKIYAGSNSIAREVGLNKVKCGEVMAIHRMFFRLDTLSQELLRQPELVKRLIVVADVVEIEGSNATLSLPGSSLVLIFCRVLILKSKDVVLDLGNWDLRVANTTPLHRCSIRAQRVVIASGSVSASLLIQLKHKLEWSDGTHLDQCFGRPFSFTASEINSSATITTRTTSAMRSINTWPGTAPVSNFTQVNSEKFNVLVNAVPWKGVVDCQAALPSLDDLLHPDVISGIQSTLLIVETILNFQTDNPAIIILARQHAEWIVDSLLQVVHLPNSTVGVSEIKTLLARAQMLMKLPTDGSQHLRVPLLAYGEYQEDIERLLRNAEAYDQEYRALTRFVQLVEIIGSEFLQLSKSLAQRERDIEAFESLVAIRKQSELDQAIRRMNSLMTEIERRSFEMADAKARMEEGCLSNKMFTDYITVKCKTSIMRCLIAAGLQDYNRRQLTRAIFGILGALLQLCASLKFGGGADIAGGIATTVPAAVDLIHAVQDASASTKLLAISQTLMDLEKIVDVVNAVNALVESATELEDIIHAPELPLIQPYTWDILENDIEEFAALMPSEVSEVVTWKAKCRNLVAVCREICIAASFACEVQYELFVHARQQEMARRQAERLEGMQTAADLSSYIELATQADMRTTRLLLSLLNVLAGHQGALHYHYLMELEVFTSSWPSVDGVRMHLLQLNQRARARENALFGDGVLTVDLQHDYVLDAIPVSLLLSGEDWSFTINPERNASAFPTPWDYVRIRYVEMKFTGEHQPVSKTGEIYLLLRSSANFQDRLEEQVLEYEAAVPLVYQYAYNLSTGATTLPNLPSESGKFFRMTPFTRWRLRLSASAYQNEGVSFPTLPDHPDSADSPVQITIAFYVTALPQIQSRSLDV